MITLYIDNNILGLEQYWQTMGALRKSISESRVIISDWHMVELTSITDRPQALKRANFLDSLNPLWMRGYLPIQKSEAKRYVWQHYYKIPSGPIRVFTELLSEVWADYLGPETVLGLNAKKWVAINHDPSMLSSEKSEIIDALGTLQEATAGQKRKIEPDVFLRWILPRIDDRNPDGRAITISEKKKIATFCYDNRHDLYSCCPALAVENALHKIRSRDATRQPKASDAIDLFHGVLALSYCDYYLTRDGFARQCAIYAKAALPSLRTAEIYKTIDELNAVIGTKRSTES